MWDKKYYVVYGEMLDFYLHHRVQMTHIYCIITFRVANWLKPYIELTQHSGMKPNALVMP